MKNRKDFFYRYAQDEGFDPLIADNWYPISFDSVCSKKVMNAITKIIWDINAKLFYIIGRKVSGYVL